MLSTRIPLSLLITLIFSSTSSARALIRHHRGQLPVRAVAFLRWRRALDRGHEPDPRHAHRAGGEPQLPGVSPRV